MKTPRVSFAIMLPVLSMVLWIALVAVPTSLLFLQFETLAGQAHSIQLSSGPFDIDLTRERFFYFALQSATVKTGHFIEAANTPGLAGEFLISIRTWPATWLPSGFVLDSWRSLVMPLFCLPFWMYVGTGIDALIYRRLKRWPVFLAGSFLSAFFLFLFCGLRFGLSASDREGLVYPLWGFAVWALLFGVFPYAWVAQRLRKA